MENYKSLNNLENKKNQNFLSPQRVHSFIPFQFQDSTYTNKNEEQILQNTQEINFRILLNKVALLVFFNIIHIVVTMYLTFSVFWYYIRYKDQTVRRVGLIFQIFIDKNKSQKYQLIKNESLIQQGLTAFICLWIAIIFHIYYIKEQITLLKRCNITNREKSNIIIQIQKDSKLLRFKTLYKTVFVIQLFAVCYWMFLTFFTMKFENNISKKYFFIDFYIALCSPFLILLSHYYFLKLKEQIRQNIIVTQLLTR